MKNRLQRHEQVTAWICRKKGCYTSVHPEKVVENQYHIVCDSCGEVVQILHSERNKIEL